MKWEFLIALRLTGRRNVFFIEILCYAIFRVDRRLCLECNTVINVIEALKTLFYSTFRKTQGYELIFQK